MARRQRLILVGVLAVVITAVCIVAKDALTAALRWVDFLAPMPGLSGLLLLVLVPVGFVLVAAVVQWAVNGSVRDKEPDHKN